MARKILVACSDDDFREFLTHQFRCTGADVESVGAGTTCVEWLKRRWPDVLVLDENLKWGGADGVIDWLHHTNSFDRIEIVRVGKHRKYRVNQQAFSSGFASSS